MLKDKEENYFWEKNTPAYVINYEQAFELADNDLRKNGIEASPSSFDIRKIFIMKNLIGLDLTSQFIGISYWNRAYDIALEDALEWFEDNINEANFENEINTIKTILKTKELEIENQDHNSTIEKDILPNFFNNKN